MWESESERVHRLHLRQCSKGKGCGVVHTTGIHYISIGVRRNVSVRVRVSVCECV